MRFAGHNFKKSRPKGDFYETPEIAVEKLLEKEPFAGEVWDPASGGGAICRVLEKHGFKVIGSDIREDKKVWGDKGVDFLRLHEIFENVIVNPPFRLALEFALHAIDCAEKKVALFQKLQFLEGQTRRADLFSKYPPNRIWVFVSCLSCPDGTKKVVKKKNGGMLAFCWYIWDKTLPPEQKHRTLLNWID